MLVTSLNLQLSKERAKVFSQSKFDFQKQCSIPNQILLLNTRLLILNGANRNDSLRSWNEQEVTCCTGYRQT